MRKAVHSMHSTYFQSNQIAYHIRKHCMLPRAPPQNHTKYPTQRGVEYRDSCVNWPQGVQFTYVHCPSNISSKERAVSSSNHREIVFQPEIPIEEWLRLHSGELGSAGKSFGSYSHAYSGRYGVMDAMRRADG